MKSYYYLDENGQQQGPISLSELMKNTITRDTLVWTEGMSDWKQADTVPELASIFQAPLSRQSLPTDNAQMTVQQPLRTQQTNTVEKMPQVKAKSEFTGTILGVIGIGFLTMIILILTLCLGLPWAICIRERWYARNTFIEGKQLLFNGNGSQLFGKYIVWMLLTLITFGIYLFWLNLSIKKWVVKHTRFAE